MEFCQVLGVKKEKQGSDDEIVIGEHENSEEPSIKAYLENSSAEKRRAITEMVLKHSLRIPLLFIFG